MEHDFLSQIRDTEDEALKLVAKARAEAHQKIQASRQKASANIADIQTDVKTLEENFARETAARIDDIQQEMLRKAAEQIEQLNQGTAEMIQDAAGIIVERIVKDCVDC